MLQFFIGIGGHPQGPDLQDLGIEKSFRMGFHIGGQLINQVLRLAASGGDKDPVAGMDIFKDIIGGNKLMGILLLPMFKHSYRPRFELSQ